MVWLDVGVRGDDGGNGGITGAWIRGDSAATLAWGGDDDGVAGTCMVGIVRGIDGDDKDGTLGEGPGENGALFDAAAAPGLVFAPKLLLSLFDAGESMYGSRTARFLPRDNDAGAAASTPLVPGILVPGVLADASAPVPGILVPGVPGVLGAATVTVCSSALAA